MNGTYRVTLVAKTRENPADPPGIEKRLVRPADDAHQPGTQGGVLFGSDDGLAVEINDKAEHPTVDDVIQWYWIKGYPSPETHDLLEFTQVPDWTTDADLA